MNNLIMNKKEFGENENKIWNKKKMSFPNNKPWKTKIEILPFELLFLYN